MSSGSYFTIYRKQKNVSLPKDKLDALIEEYKKSGANDLFPKENKNENVPILMQEDFKYVENRIEDTKSNNFYDKDGILHEKLLDFSFCSSFTCLKSKFNLNPYKRCDSSKLISREEASKMLQAIRYVLNGEYSLQFEDILNNEYVKLFGNGYSLFNDRFNSRKDKIYIDKDSDDGYSISFGDDQYNAEIAECDDDIIFNLKHAKSCLQAFLDAECYSWDDFELVLEYTAW